MLGLDKGREVTEPDALLFQAPKEPLYDPILLGSIGSHELLPESVIPARGTKTSALEDQAIVAPHDRRGACSSEGPETGQAGRFDGPFRLLRWSPEGQLLADHFPVMAVHHRHQMGPAIPSTGDMGHIRTTSY